MTKKILMICGKSQSGKDTLADYIYKKYNYPNKTALAKFLKHTLNKLFGLSLTKLNGTDEEKNELTHLFVNGKYLTYREALKWFGSDVCRKADENCWARKVCEYMEYQDSIFYTNSHIVSDVRWLNDWRYIRDFGTKYDYEIKTIKLGRDIKPYDPHDSEAELDTFPESCFDLVVPPDYDENETFTLVKHHLEKWGFAS